VETILTPAQHQTLQMVMWETRPGLGRGLYGAGTALGWEYGLGLGQGAGLARPGSLRPGLGQGLGRGSGRGLGRGMGRGRGLRWWR
jgi:hypothetical protein